MTASPGNATEGETTRERKNSKETIHSGHFMVSDFEAEAQDEEGVEVPDPAGTVEQVEQIQGVMGISQGGVITYAKPTGPTNRDNTTVSIDATLTKLFKTMSLAYRQNITSPKWNRFKGIRLRWKDKIRLNNVIWRCWHMQYKQKKNMRICQFALDVDIHNRPEAVVLEGKYWKRRLQAVTAEYKKWRVYYKNTLTGLEPMMDQGDMAFLGLEEMDWAGSFFNKQGSSFEEGCLLDSIDFTDMLFSPFVTSPQLFPFPNPREIARGTGNSDLLQPGLIQLQPDLMDDDDMMDIHEMLAGRGLPTVPEEDLFHDVEDTAGLPPPSSSPPSISTPTPTAHTDYNARHTSIHPYRNSNNPSSPQQLFHPQETFIPSRQPPPQTAHIPPPTHVLPQPEQDFKQEYKFDLRQEGSQRPFTRTLSAQEVHHQEPTTPREIPRQNTMGHELPFAVPKSIPKKKYFGGGGISNWAPMAPINTSGAAIIGPTTLVFPSPVSPVGQGLNSEGHQRHGGALPLESGVDVSVGTHPAASDSAIFAHIFSSDNYPAPGNQATQSPHHTNKIKVARITPRPYPDIANTPVTSASSKSTSSSTLIFNNNNNNNNNNISNSSSCGNNAITVVNTSHQPHLLANVTLSAVTPSSIKTIQASNSWTTPTGCLKSIKASPPYPEPNSPTNSQTNAASPPSKPFRPKNDVERVQYKEHRRVCHINAEQKRRCNIKNNFEMLHSLIPSVSQNPNAKVSKATMLHKGAEYIMQMKQERQQLSDQSEQLRNQIETLSSEISLAQSMLPATGAPMSHTRHNKIKEKFDGYLRDRTLANPKYYVLALIAQPLLQTYNSSVSTASVDDLCRSSMAWLDQHCSLNVLRPVVSNAMRKLSVTTNILTTPETLYEDIFRQVTKREVSNYNNTREQAAR